MAKKEEKTVEKQTVIVIKNEITIDGKSADLKINSKPTIEAEAPLTTGPVYIPKSKKNLTTFDGLVEQSVSHRRSSPLRGITVK